MLVGGASFTGVAGAGVTVGVSVSGTSVAVDVLVGRGVFVSLGVDVTVGVLVGVALLVAVGMGMGVSVATGVCVFVGVGVYADVGVAKSKEIWLHPANKLASNRIKINKTIGLIGFVIIIFPDGSSGRRFFGLCGFLGLVGVVALYNYIDNYAQDTHQGR